MTDTDPTTRAEHTFRAWRLEGSPSMPVSWHAIDPATLALEVEDDI